MAPTRSLAHPYGHAKAQRRGHPCIPGLLRARLRPLAPTVPRGPGAPQAGGAPQLPGTPPGATTRCGFPLWHVQKPAPTVCPAEGPRQSSHLRGARRHAGAAPTDKELWPLPALQPHAASRSTASRLPRGYRQRPWKSQRGPGPTDIIYHRSPTPVQEAPHQTSAHPHHSHASHGSASHGPPPGSRQGIQLIRHLCPRVSSQPTAGGTARQGHTAKGTRGRPKACTGGGGTTPRKPPPRTGRDDTSPGHGHRPPDQLAPYTTPAAKRPNHQGAPQKPEHDASGPGADAEMTETSGGQESGESLLPRPA